MSRGQMSLNEDNDGQRKRRTSEIELGIVRAENQEDELNREADPEEEDRKSTRLNSSHSGESRMPSSA